MDHSELEDKLGEYAVGLAIYSSEDSWNYYRDSMKVREYLAAGVPVICDPVPSASEDIRGAGAGVVVSLNVNVLALAITDLLTNDNVWLNCRENALLLAHKFDKDILLAAAFTRICSKKPV